MPLTEKETRRLIALLAQGEWTDKEKLVMKALAARQAGVRIEGEEPGAAEGGEKKSLTCPECGHSWEGNAEGTITCPSCGHTFEKAAAEPEADPAAAKSANFLANAKAAISSKTALLAENSELKARLGKMRAQLALLTADHDQARAELLVLVDERAALQTALDQAMAKEKSVTAATVDALASLGVPAAGLPAPDATGGVNPREALVAQFAAERNSAKKAALFQQIKELDQAKRP